MVSFTILAGGYDTFIATYLFSASSSSLSLLDKYPTGPSPSWISLHPRNRSILYAVNEVNPGALQSFEVDSQGRLSAAIDTVSSGGNSPAFTAALSTGEVAVFNFLSGNGRIVPTTTSPLIFDHTAHVITLPQPAPPGASHPHQAVEHHDEVFVPDLGGDKIWRLSRDSRRYDYAIQGFIPQPRNSGPRHLAIYDERLFTLHEHSSTLTVQLIPPALNGTSTIIDSVSITPPNPPNGSHFAAGEIVISARTPRFPIPYIYVSNRNIGVCDPRGDTVAIFEHVNKGRMDESLVLVKQVYTGINQPRGVSIGPEFLEGADEFLIAGGVAGTAGVIVFRRTEGGRNLEVVAHNREIPTRTTFAWI